MTTAYTREIRTAAAAHGLDPRLVTAQVLVESAGLTHAYRFESGFWARYCATNPKWKDANPQRVSASYGLLQVMYVVAVELGFTGEPELLFVPSIGLDWGCRKLATLLQWAEGDIVRALAAYNGGKAGNATPPLRNAAYAERVLAMLATVPDPLT